MGARSKLNHRRPGLPRAGRDHRRGERLLGNLCDRARSGTWLESVQPRHSVGQAGQELANQTRMTSPMCTPSRLARLSRAGLVTFFSHPRPRRGVLEVLASASHPERTQWTAGVEPLSEDGAGK
jgi:hypothetical protein